jgi:hypothetical protein
MADNAALDANALARMLGVSPKEIYDLTKAGVVERGEGRLYSVEDSVQRYCEWLRRQVTLDS